MKLYNRDQMIEAMRFVFMHEADETPVEFIDTLTPIELPSDEQIDEYASKYSADGAIILGAKWMKEQILNQNK